MPDFEHYRFSYSRMNPRLGESARAIPHNPGVSYSDPEPNHASSDSAFYFDNLDSGFLSGSFSYLHPSASVRRTSIPPLPPLPPPPPPPAAATLRNDLGSNISVLKTLNLRFRCFLAKVHELERRNKALENQLQQALEANNNTDKAKRNSTVHPRPDFVPTSTSNDAACLIKTSVEPRLRLDSTEVMPRNKVPVENLDTLGIMDLNSNLSPPLRFDPASPIGPKSITTSIRQSYDGIDSESSTISTPRVLPTSIWFPNPPGRFNTGWDLGVCGPRVSWPYQDEVGVQIDTITPEIRALNNVLAKVKMERDEYKRRWEREYAVRVDLQEKITELEEDLYMSEMCQDKLALQVKQLKAELVVFKGLMSNNLSELDSKIQEKAMKVDMDICRRIDITARLCDVAQQRNCEDLTQIFQQVATPTSTLNRCHCKQASQTIKFNDGEGSISEREECKKKEAELCGSLINPVNEEMQRMLNQLHDGEFEDDCDSLAWEETEETLLLWGDFPGYTLAVDSNGEGQEESIEKVIKDTEFMFKSREKDYQETIDQIELELATAKSDMNRHLHEYMEMCSMKRGLDVQMETCRRLITQTEDRKSPCLISVPVEDAEEGAKERKKASLVSDANSAESCCDNLNNSSVAHLPWMKS